MGEWTSNSGLEERGKAVREFPYLSQDAQIRLQRIARLARVMFDLADARVRLIDVEEEYTEGPKSRPLDITFCEYVLNSGQPMIVTDAAEDVRFCETQAVRGPGQWRFYAGAPIRHPNGTIIGTLALLDTKPRQFGEAETVILRDFAALVEDEIALLIGRFSAEHALDLYLSITRNFPYALIIGQFDDKDNHDSLRVISVNTALSNATGLAEDLFNNQLLVQVIPNIRKTRLLKNALESVKTGAPSEIPEFSYTDHRIPTRYFIGSIVPLPGDRVCISLENITGRKEDRRHLAELVATLHATIEATGSGIIAITHEQVALLNRKYSEMWDVPPDAPWRLDRAQLAAHCTRQVRDPVWFLDRFQWILDHPDQDTSDEVELLDGRILERVSQPQIVDGQIIGRVYAFRDITERRQYELQIADQIQAISETNIELAEARHKADAATRLKTEFLATMSHELRTPLNAVIGYTDIMLQEIDAPIHPQHRNYLERTMLNAENLLNLINDVLDVAKIEAGRVELQRRPMQPIALLGQIMLQMGGLAEKKALQLDGHATERMPRIILGDYSRTLQILINLVGNAIKFTDSGLIDIILDRPDQDYWSLTVRDTGVGIPEGMHDFIFDEFRQVDMSSSRRAGGTGLGLAIVRKLVLLANGRIELKSEPGVGSVFTVYLPLFL